ncbi:MAG: hypothetical protein V4702_03425 [Patescibacteria group bacterium]
MAKASLKKKLKLSKKQQKQFRKLLITFGIGLAGFMTGILTTVVLNRPEPPRNLVWAADIEVSVPKDLRKFLENQSDCQQYRGTDSPTGVGLWGVYQTSKGRFAKIAYGCSWSLSSYIMAIKQDDQWQLLQPTEYFAPFKDGVSPAQGALPYCSIIEKYKIPKDIESFCISNDNKAQSNDF